MSNRKINFKTVCPKCQTKLSLDPDLEDVLPSPKLRSNHKPATELLVYKETTETIKQFLTEKCRAYAPDINIELITRYNERKNRKNEDWEPHRGYAYFILCMTANEAMTPESDDLYTRIASEGRDNVSLISEIRHHIKDKYKWDINWVKAALNDYKVMTKLEESLGLTPAMLAEIKQFSEPRVIKSNNVAWVEVAISVEKVLADMFTDVTTKNTVPFMIRDVRPISENNIQYEIHVDPYGKKSVEMDQSISMLIQNSIKNK
jgi:hypothetical protein